MCTVRKYVWITLSSVIFSFLLSQDLRQCKLFCVRDRFSDYGNIIGYAQAHLGTSEHALVTHCWVKSRAFWVIWIGSRQTLAIHTSPIMNIQQLPTLTRQHAKTPLLSRNSSILHTTQKHIQNMHSNLAELIIYCRHRIQTS